MTNNLSRSDEYNSMITTNESYGAVSFEQCNMIVKQEVLDLTKENNANFDKDNSFNMEEFAEYMGRIEEKFKCTGWCSIKYSKNVNGSKSNEIYMNKYLVFMMLWLHINNLQYFLFLLSYINVILINILYNKLR